MYYSLDYGTENIIPIIIKCVIGKSKKCLLNFYFLLKIAISNGFKISFVFLVLKTENVDITFICANKTNPISRVIILFIVNSINWVYLYWNLNEFQINKIFSQLFHDYFYTKSLITKHIEIAEKQNFTWIKYLSFREWYAFSWKIMDIFHGNEYYFKKLTYFIHKKPYLSTVNRCFIRWLLVYEGYIHACTQITMNSLNVDGLNGHEHETFDKKRKIFTSGIIIMKMLLNGQSFWRQFI